MRKKLPAVLAVGALMIATPLAADAAPQSGKQDGNTQRTTPGSVEIDPSLKPESSPLPTR